MKNTQEFFQLGVTKPSKFDVQNYLNHLGTRLMQVPDIKRKIINHFKNIKNLKLDPYGKTVLSFEEVEVEEGVDWTKFDTPFGGRHGKKFDSWDEWEKVEKDAKKLEKTQNGKKRIKTAKNNKKLPQNCSKLPKTILKDPCSFFQRMVCLVRSERY